MERAKREQPIEIDRIAPQLRPRGGSFDEAAFLARQPGVDIHKHSDGTITFLVDHALASVLETQPHFLHDLASTPLETPEAGVA